MSLIEQISEMGISQTLMGIPTNVRMESLFPDYIQVVGNWSTVVNDNKIVIGSVATTETPVFGTTYMYPPSMLSSEIVSTAYVVADINPSNIDNYTYAFEIYMARTPSKRKYSGIGALTMAYNSRAQNTSEYVIDSTQLFPTVTSSDGTFQVYVSANLEDSSGNNEWILEIWSTSVSNVNVKNSVFNHKFNVTPVQFKNAVSGLITTVVSAYSNSASAVNTVQVIMPDDIKEAYSKNAASLNTSSSRTTYLYEYVFGSSFNNPTVNTISVPSSNPVVNGIAFQQFVNAFVPLNLESG